MTKNRILVRGMVLLFSLVVALVLCAGAFFVVNDNGEFSGMAAGGVNASATAEPDKRVELKYLMERHEVDYAIGPIKNTTIGNTTYNNEYGIESDIYFDYTNYLYIDNENGKKTLHGWKNNILPAEPTGVNIATSGKSTAGGNQIYIYAQKKYVIVLPDDVEALGTSNYYYDRYFNNYSTYTKPSSTAYTNFSFYWGPSNVPERNWCPRERLAGFYCGEKSKLSEIAGVDASPVDRPEYSPVDDADRKNKCDALRPALFACNNMRFCILPDKFTEKVAEGEAASENDTTGLTDIGAYAFGRCTQLRDVNIPNSVSAVGDYAFNHCSQLPHITIPSDINFGGDHVFEGASNLRDIEDHAGYGQSNFPAAMNYTTSENGSALFVVGTNDGDMGKQAFYFCYNTILDNGTALATVNGEPSTKFAGYTQNRWYAIGLAGVEDKTKSTIYELPSEISVEADDPRRVNIAYDYINPDGTGHKNTLDSVVTEYDIAASMVTGTWCGNVIIPAAVTTIGDHAFDFCHLQYLELGANVKNIGYCAFYDNRGQMGVAGASLFSGTQYYYIHCGDVKMGNNAFDGSSRSGTLATARWFIFDNKQAYDSHKDEYSSSGIDSVLKKYEVPVRAVVESTGGDVDVKGEMETLFRHDSDFVDGTYKESPVGGGNGKYTVTYTKRLYGSARWTVKTPSGYWGNNAGNYTVTIPTLVGNSESCWYDTPQYGNKITNLSTVLSSTVSNVGYIYTKKICKADIDISKINKYVYRATDDNGAPFAGYNFDDALNLDKSLYRAEFVSYTDMSGATTVTPRSVMTDAGTYRLRVQLNEKWGRWSNAPDEYDVTVEQAKIDLGKPENLPVFSANAQLLGGVGDGTPLYFYPGDNGGWFIYKRAAEPSNTVSVLNSYARFTGNEITIAPSVDGLNYRLESAATKGDNSGTNSKDNYAAYQYSAVNQNYAVITDSKDENAAILSKYGISFDESASIIYKRWYIVKQDNWLIDSANAPSAGDEPTTTGYVLATEKGTAEAVNTWDYEEEVDVHIPVLAYTGTGSPKIKFTMVYNDTDVIAENIDVDLIKNYINNAMPAGTYSVVISADAVTLGDGSNYPEFSERITLNVKKTEIAADRIIAALTGDSAEGRTFEFANDGSIQLHDDIDDLLADINKNTDRVRNTAKNSASATRAAADNIWIGADYDKYYGDVAITYNLDSMRTSAYVTESELAGYSNVPNAVGEYIVYYSLSAPNGVTVGGTENTVSRRDYRFNTVVYMLHDAASYFASTSSGLYIAPTVYYLGENRDSKPATGYSEYFNYEFGDSDYVNAGKDRTVTVKFHNGKLNRWDTTKTDPRVVVNKNNTVTVKFDIEPAENGWTAAPQISAWTYDGFDSETYRISSVQKFSGARVRYMIGTRTTAGDDEHETYTYSWQSFGENDYFELDANGAIPASVAAVLGKLKPDTYYLASVILASRETAAGSNVYNVKSYTTAPENYNEIIIGKAVNRWTQSPQVIRWDWNLNDRTEAALKEVTNLITAVPLYSNIPQSGVTNAVKYTVLDGNYKVLNNTALIEFTTVDDAVISALALLPAGDYYLLASVSATDYYTEINILRDENTNAVIPITPALDLRGKGLNLAHFAVNVASGGWQTTPAVISWTYGSFSTANNFVFAEPLFGENVLYSLYRTYENGMYSDPVVNGVGISAQAVAAIMQDLGADEYFMSVYTDPATPDMNKNFKQAVMPLSFTVRTLANGWTATPAIDGWTYGSAGSFSAASAAKGAVKYKLVRRTADGETVIVSETADYSKIEEQLAAMKLDAGDYTLTLTVDELKNPVNNEVNFTSVSKQLDFTVARANNGWLGGITPSAVGFEWDGTTKSVTVTQGTALQGTTARVFYKMKYDEARGTYVRDGEIDMDDIVNVGKYAYVTSAEQTTNYNGIEVEALFDVLPATNVFTGLAANKKIEFYWSKFDGTGLPTARFGDVRFTIAGMTVGRNGNADSHELGIIDVLNSLDAGEHSLRIFVSEPDTLNYNGLDETVVVKINKTVNKWNENLAAPASYVWNTDSAAVGDLFTLPVPYAGNVVSVTVSRAERNGAGKETLVSVFYMELHYTDGVLTAAELENLTGRLAALGVGDYEIAVAVTESNNTTGLDGSKRFEVLKAKDKWKDGGAPAISVNKWKYGGTAGTLSASAEFGAPVYTYYTAGGAVIGDGTQMPVDAGSYKVGVKTADNTNYSGADEVFIQFTVEKADENGFSINPYAIGWAWKGYKPDVNKFGAVPRSGGAVTYSVYRNNNGTYELITGLNNISVDSDNVIIDPDGTIAARLNALDAANDYKLRVDVGEVKNYNAFYSEAILQITPATNRWLTAPNITRWAEHQWKADKNMPSAVAQYGDVEIKVTNRDDPADVYYHAIGKTEKVRRLDEARGGWYIFTAEVAVNNNYQELAYSADFQVFTESAEMPNNYWEIVPAIDSWIAGSTPSVPEYKSLRGTEIITYAKAERVDGRYVAVGTPTSTLPEAPGKYFMLARVKNPTYAPDEALKLDVLFEIFERTNEWTVSPSIRNWELGNAAPVPVADVLVKEDHKIEYSFALKDGTGQATSYIPRVPGTYIMTVRATAKYCTPLEAQIEFTVALSKNSWISAPTIKDWSEEFAASTPEAVAAAGNDRIVYTYARRDAPDVLLKGKPTTEGAYIMYATVELDGYETLTASYEFTVSAAYDRQLVIVDILLGVVACALAVAVIIFAVRRYKENG